MLRAAMELDLAKRSLDGPALTAAELARTLGPDVPLLPLLHEARIVREASFGNRVRVHILNNAQNARCPEDCGYCSQSAITDAPLRPYPWKPKAELIDEAKRAYAAGAFRYCMVASGRGPTDRQVEYLCDAVRAIRAEVPVRICVSVGLLDQAKAQRLKDAGVDRLNHKKVRPTEFDDLVALNALYRPGAMRHIDTYARNKRRPDMITYIDERLRAITEATYSVILYQEQSMQIAKSIAGFSGPEADDLRKAIGKKDRQRMASLKERFFEGARGTGTAENVIQELWSVNEAAADYSFNRSHAACYAVIGYRTAWLKANYTAEYMAALISSVMSTKDKVPFFVSRCEEMGIEVLPPDVNESGHDFQVIGGNIRFGLDAVKNVGAAAVDAVLGAREKDGPFTSIWDFCERVDCRAVNKKAIESLVRCGALDSTGASRTGMLEVLPSAQGSGQQHQQDALLGQGSIFDFEEPSDGAPESPFLATQHPPVPPLEDDRKELNLMEKETLGLFLSSHPFKEVRAALRQKVECSIADLKGKNDGEWVTVGGMIAEAKRIRTKKGDPMMFATLDDLEGQVEILIFNSAYASNEDKLDVDKVVIVRGRVDHKEQGETKLVVQEAEIFEPSEEEVAKAREEAALNPAHPARRITLNVPAGVSEAWLDEFKAVVRHNRGDHEVMLQIGDRSLVLGDDYRVSPSSAFRTEVAGLPSGAAELVV